MPNLGSSTCYLGIDSWIKSLFLTSLHISGRETIEAKMNLRFRSLGPPSLDGYSGSHFEAIELNFLRWEMFYLNFSEAKNYLFPFHTLCQNIHWNENGKMLTDLRLCGKTPNRVWSLQPSPLRRWWRLQGRPLLLTAYILGLCDRRVLCLCDLMLMCAIETNRPLPYLTGFFWGLN